MIGVLLIPRDPRVTEDLTRWDIRRLIQIAHHGLVEEAVARAKGEEIMVFASGRRRWHDVAEALRSAVQVGTGAVGLRFYGPDFLLGVRLPLDDAESRFVLCPTLELGELKPEGGGGYFATVYRLRRAVKDALADLIGAEMRALADEILAGARSVGMA